MPTITDATVVAQPYNTSGNGGRKLVMLDSGTLVAAVKDAASQSLWKTTDNWTTKTEITSHTSYASFQDVALCTDEKNIFRLFGYNNSTIVFNSLNESGVILTSLNIDSGQNALGNVSLTINEAKTELHAAWSSKNSTYPNSFNIRYAKGTINSDGSVTWGTVEQVTNLNAASLSYSQNNPSVVVNGNGYPVILTSGVISSDNKNSIRCLYKNSSGWVTNNGYGNEVYRLADHNQSNPSAIYVPQSINGLANGRIWVAWHGLDLTESAYTNIRVSYSDDRGESWSPAQKITQGNQYNKSIPTITYDSRGKISVLFMLNYATGNSLDVRKIDYNGSWSSEVLIKNTTVPNYPNAIEFIKAYESPLFIFSDSGRVGFYGSWVVQRISPPIGERGQILNRQNILTYNITSDSVIGTVTEKINGVVVGTKALNSGQNTTINITQAQWDAIPYGKYQNNNAARNTIEIVTSAATFRYTFEKWIDNTADTLSSIKAVKDSKDYYMPSAKKILSDAINSKGGITSKDDSLEYMAEELNQIPEYNVFKGNFTSTNANTAFVTYNNGNYSTYKLDLDLSVIGFEPDTIRILRIDKALPASETFYKKDEFYHGTNNYYYDVIHCYNNVSTTFLRSISSGSVITLPVGFGSAEYTVWATKG